MDVVECVVPAPLIRFAAFSLNAFLVFQPLRHKQRLVLQQTLLLGRRPEVERYQSRQPPVSFPQLLQSNSISRTSGASATSAASQTQSISQSAAVSPISVASQSSTNSGTPAPSTVIGESPSPSPSRSSDASLTNTATSHPDRK